MARRFISPLTETDRQALADIHQYGQKRASRRRAHAILLSDQGYTITQISDILEVGRNTLTIWFQKWEAAGLEEIIDKPRSGRNPILDDSDREILQTLVEKLPHQLRTLQARLQEETGKIFSTVTLRRALKKKSK